MEKETEGFVRLLRWGTGLFVEGRFHVGMEYCLNWSVEKGNINVFPYSAGASGLRYPHSFNPLSWVRFTASRG